VGYGSTYASHLFEATKFDVRATQYLSLTCDEVSTIDNQN
jgi:hypothetical protein